VEEIEMNDVVETGRVQSYFDGKGFERLSVIYGEEPCTGFRRAVRQGHRQVVETVLSWLCPRNPGEHQTVLDAGCGTGSLSIPLAQAGVRVDGIDFSERMIESAKDRARRLGLAGGRLAFHVRDLNSICQPYDTIVCIDVFARYSTEDAVEMLRHLSSLARERLVFTFTPKTVLDSLWRAIGAVCATRSQALPLYTHRREAIVKALESYGWTVHREAMFSAGFRSYFCRLVETRRAAADSGVPEIWF
jgi:magnesium-protoporphyrin O-methyltransferase